MLEQASAAATSLVKQGAVCIMLQAPCEDILYSRAKVYAGEQWTCATIVGGHTRIVSIERQGETLKEQTQGAEPVCPLRWGFFLHQPVRMLLHALHDAVHHHLHAVRQHAAPAVDQVGLHIDAAFARQAGQ